MPLSTAVEQLREALAKMKHPLILGQPLIVDAQQRIRWATGGGYLHLAPVLITVNLTARGAEATGLRISSVGRKQRFAQKSLLKLIDPLDAH